MVRWSVEIDTEGGLSCEKSRRKVEATKRSPNGLEKGMEFY